jgi:hypothetical protein
MNEDFQDDEDNNTFYRNEEEEEEAKRQEVRLKSFLLTTIPLTSL